MVSLLRCFCYGRHLTTDLLLNSFILAVQAELLGNKQSMNINSKDAVIVCAVTSAVATLVSGLWINVPFAIVPAMGVNAYIAEDVSFVKPSLK